MKKNFNVIKLVPNLGPEKRKESSPFGKALFLAKMITNRTDDQSDLKKAMAGLDEQGQKNLVWRVLGEVMELRAQSPALFAVAYTARMGQVAHYGAALFKLSRDGGMSLQEMQALGLVKCGMGGIRYMVGRHFFEVAISLLQKSGTPGDFQAAEILRKPIVMEDKSRILRASARKQKNTVVGEAIIETLPESIE